jgi:hypothetical protein
MMNMLLLQEGYGDKFVLWVESSIQNIFITIKIRVLRSFCFITFILSGKKAISALGYGRLMNVMNVNELRIFKRFYLLCS